MARFPLGYRLYRAIFDIANPETRSVVRLQNRAPKNLMQPNSTTRANRYPEFFSWVSEQIKHLPHQRILSFGCSTGEEVFTLRHYFPNAELVGIDINPRNIKICNQKLRKFSQPAGIRFLCAESPLADSAGSFDTIFCMAVLRHGVLQAETPERCDPLLDFATVELLVDELAKCLKPGGYLAIWNTHFRFADMRAYKNFEVAFRHDRGGWANTPLYGSDNCRLSVEPYCDAIFRKVGTKSMII